MRGRFEVLLIDDDEDDFVFIKNLLLEIGSFQFDLDWAKTYESGLLEIGCAKHDAILVDYRLGGRNGLELIREAVAGGCLAPIVLLTAYGDYRVDNEAMEAGAADYLVKGQVNSDLLERSIRYAISRKQSERELKNYRAHLEELVGERTRQLESLVAEMHRTVDRLEDSEALFRNIFHGHAAVKLIIDPQSGNIVDANEAAATFYGWPKERLKRMNIREINVQSLEEIRDAIEKARTLNRVHFEFPHRRADGSIRDVEVFSSRIEVKGKELLHSIVHDITERKTAEASLRLAQFSIEHAADPIYWTGHDAKIIYANEAACRSLGYSKEELLSMSVLDVFTDIEYDKWAERYEEYKKGGSAVFESEHRRKDGKTFPVEVRSNNFAFDGAEFNFSVVKDITERKLADRAILQAKKDWETTFDVMPDLVAILGTDYRIIRANKAMADRLGRGKEECVGLLCYEVVHGTAEPPSSCPHELLLSDNAEHTAEIFQESLGGYFTLSVSPLFEPGGRLKGSVHVCRDVNDRKRAEEILRNSEAQLRQIIDLLPHRVFVKDREGKYLLVNKAVADGYNMSVSELTGKYHGDIHPDKSQVENMLRDDREVITNGIMKFIPEQTYTDAQGNVRFHQVTKVPFRVQGGETPAVLGIAVDITGEKRVRAEKDKLQAQLVQAQKMESIGRLAGGVAHDFNNMLGVILGYTEMALGRVDSMQPLFSDLQEIKKAAERSAELTRQLLAFARKQTALPKVLDLNGTVEGMLKMLRRVIGEDIELAWIPGGDLWRVKIDPTQIDQILANLCVNARDAIAGTGRVTIETRNVVFGGAYSEIGSLIAPGQYVMLTVSDNGCGMDKEIIGKLFEPFFTTKEVGKGTGLGLATVYGIVRQNDGFINVYSEPGNGTTFKIYLPRHEAIRCEASAPGGVKAAKGSGETILLVEDEEAILKMTKLMLERHGYRVLAAPSPDEAMRLAEEHNGEIRLLITDVVMPGMNGRDLAKKLLSHAPDAKCLFMSGCTADVIAREGVLDEGVNFIQKPFSLMDMAARVREALRRE